MFGALHSHAAAALVSDIDPAFLLRAWDWYHDVVGAENRLGVGTFVLLEIMQEKAFHSAGPADSTAWPHSSARYVLQLLTGFAPGSGCLDELAIKVLEKAPGKIAPGHGPKDYFPHFVEGYRRVDEV